MTKINREKIARKEMRIAELRHERDILRIMRETAEMDGRNADEISAHLISVNEELLELTGNY